MGGGGRPLGTPDLAPASVVSGPRQETPQCQHLRLGAAMRAEPHGPGEGFKGMPAPV